MNTTTTLSNRDNAPTPDAAATTFICPALQNLSPYAPPRHDPRITLFLDANECPPPPKVPDLPPSQRESTTRRYPSAAALESLLAERHAIDPSRIIITAGGDEAIDRICRACLDPAAADELILPSPSFEMISRYARLAGANIITPPWFVGQFPLNQVLTACTPRTKIIAVVSPNNPTGGIITRDQLLQLASNRPGTLLMVDLAYTEFADEDLTPIAVALPNAVLIRTFSKAWGCAGLRVGYAIGPKPIINAMRAVASPFPVAGTSLTTVESLLRSENGWLADRITRVRRERTELTALLRSFNIETLDSQANFILCRTAAAAAIKATLAEQGIAIRAYSPQSPLASCLRITCPANESDQSRLTAALRRAIAESAPAAATNAAPSPTDGARA